MFEKVKSNIRRYARKNEIEKRLKLHSDIPKVLYVQVPSHGNLGDQAIAMACSKMLKEHYQDRMILEFYYSDFYRYRDLFRKYVTQNDMFYLHGGGNLGDLYPKEELQRQQLIHDFKANSITIFPQSINFSNTREGRKLLEKSKLVYSKCSRLRIIARDEKSYGYAKKYFDNEVLMLPDSVLYLDGDLDHIRSENREGVIFTLRKDKEKKISDDKFENIFTHLGREEIPYTVTDTVVDHPVFRYNRDYNVISILKKIAGFKVNVTDRFHGVIFSVLTNTPVIVYKSTDHKIVEGVKWFKDIEWVHYLREDEDPTEYVMKYTSQKHLVDRSVGFKDCFLHNLFACGQR